MFTVHRLAGKPGHHGFHDRTHVFGGTGTRLADYGFDDPLEFVSGEGFGKIGFDDGDFLSFFGSKFGALTLLVLLNRLLPLFDHCGHDPAHLGIVEILLHLDFLIEHSGLDHPDNVHPQLITCFHGQLEIFGETVA